MTAAEMREAEKLEDAIECSILCDICGVKITDPNPWPFAEWLHQQGWRCDHKQVVRCPKCKGKRHRNASQT
jgi:hypothetical protein